MVDYAEALNYPSKDWTNIIIGGVMTLLSLLIVPIFIYMGYSLEIASRTIKGDDKQPKWENWGKLFSKGAGMFLIGIIYFIVPILIFVAGIIAALPTVFQTMLLDFSSSAYSLLLISLLLSAGIYIIIALLLGLLIGFVFPMALANYAAKGNLGAAFEFGEIWDRIRSVFSDYIMAYLVIIVMSILFSSIAGLTAVTVILPVFILFYFNVFVWRVYGLLYKKSKA